MSAPPPIWGTERFDGRWKVKSNQRASWVSCVFVAHGKGTRSLLSASHRSSAWACTIYGDCWCAVRKNTITRMREDSTTRAKACARRTHMRADRGTHHIHWRVCVYIDTHTYIHVYACILLYINMCTYMCMSIPFVVPKPRYQVLLMDKILHLFYAVASCMPPDPHV